MRLLLCAIYATFIPASAFSQQPLCGMPSFEAAERAGLPSSVLGVADNPKLLPAARLQLPPVVTHLTQPILDGSQREQSTLPPVSDIPVLRHVASSGAVLTNLDTRNGMRSVLARRNAEFLTLWVAPSGAAAVSGFLVDLPFAQLATIAGSGLTDLGMQHGLRAVLVRNGPQFQVFYVLPDGERVIPGIMWDAAGKNLTREILASVEGTLPTVSIGDPPVAPGAPSSATVPAQPVGATAPSADRMAVVERAVAGTAGNPAAPRLWMFADPQCGYSSQALQRLQPFVSAGRLRLSIIPVAILDHQNGGRSTSSSSAMLGMTGEQMIAAWSRGDLRAPPSAEAARHLETNMQAANAVGIRGTPTFFWRRAGGGEGRHDGMPSDVEALLASVGRG